MGGGSPIEECFRPRTNRASFREYSRAGVRGEGGGGGGGGDAAFL